MLSGGREAGAQRSGVVGAVSAHIVRGVLLARILCLIEGGRRGGGGRLTNTQTHECDTRASVRAQNRYARPKQKNSSYDFQPLISHRGAQDRIAAKRQHYFYPTLMVMLMLRGGSFPQCVSTLSALAFRRLLSAHLSRRLLSAPSLAHRRSPLLPRGGRREGPRNVALVPLLRPGSSA